MEVTCGSCVFRCFRGEQAGLRGKGIEICGASWFDLVQWSHAILLFAGNINARLLLVYMHYLPRL